MLAHRKSRINIFGIPNSTFSKKVHISLLNIRFFFLMFVLMHVHHIFCTFHTLYRYTQGMSDLLAPVLCEIKNESETFWSFVGLMQRAFFVCTPTDNDIDKNLVSTNVYDKIVRHTKFAI